MLSTQPSNSTKKFPAELQPSSLHPSSAGNPLLSPRPNATGFAVPPSPRVTGMNGEVIDQWFQDLQKYEATLGAMAVASEDPKFREELGTIEQWFKLLSESEQTASLYTLLQHARPNQVKFLSAVLQQMSDNNATTSSTDNSTQKAGKGVRPPSLNLPSTPTASQFESPAVEKDAAAAKVKGEQGQGPAQELVVKPAEENSWASMVATPQDLMFKKASESQPSAGVAAPASAAVPLSASGTGNGSASGLVGPAAGMAAGLAAGMMNPFNMAMLNNLGFSTEAQILAVQLVMSGMVQPTGIQKPVQAKHHHNRAANSSNNWRSAPGSARYPGSALRSSGLRSSGLKSALKANTPKSSAVPSAGTLGSATTPKEEDIDPELLKDVPAWLKSLRLHKYTDCFSGMTWEEMIDLTDEQLEKKGVVALGARRRMIRTFENVKRKMGIEFTPTVPVTAGVEASSTLPTVPEAQVPHSAMPVL